MGAVILKRKAKGADWRLARCVAAAVLLLSGSGCASIFQNFSPIESPYLYGIPANVVANQVACELQMFLKDNDNNARYAFKLNERAKAKISLALQTDITGNVTYVGLDLNKFGLTALGELIAVKSNVPSLGIKGQAKSTVSALVEMNVSQKIWTERDWATKGKNCSGTLGSALRHLALQEWLKSFFEKLEDDGVVDMSAVTLKTEFQLLVDISTGVNPLFASTFICRSTA